MLDIKDINYEPNMEEIGALINNPLFTELCQHLELEYKVLCKIEYSKDVWLRLMIDLETSRAVYSDVLKLINIRRQSK